MSVTLRTAVLILNPVIAAGMGINVWLGCLAIIRVDKFQETFAGTVNQDGFLSLLAATKDAWEACVVISLLAIFLVFVNMSYVCRKPVHQP